MSPTVSLLSFLFLLACDQQDGELTSRQTVGSQAEPGTSVEKKVESPPASEVEVKVPDSEDENKDNGKESEVLDNGEFTLKSNAFGDNGVIPAKHGCVTAGGENIAPQLIWENPPEGTKSYTLIVDDETAPCGQGSEACKHWQVYNIPTTITSIDEGGNDGSVLHVDVTQGNNYNNTSTYAGPCPPSEHFYYFKIYAMAETFLGVGEGDAHTRTSFDVMFEPHILGTSTLKALYTPQ